MALRPGGPLPEAVADHLAAAVAADRPARVLALVATQLRGMGDAERAAGEKRYLKSPLRFHGVTMPQVRQVAAALARLPGPSASDPRRLRALVQVFADSSFHDLRSIGVGLLERRSGLLGTDDLPFLIGLVAHLGNWAHVDWLATKVLGPVIARTPARQRTRWLRRWAGDPDLWVRRAALLAQLDQLRAGAGDWSLFAVIAAGRLHEKEFFIRKAIGWVLRDVSRRRPQLAFDFLKAHGDQASGLTFREGSRGLPATMRAALKPPSRRKPSSASARAISSQSVAVSVEDR